MGDDDDVLRALSDRTRRGLLDRVRKRDGETLADYARRWRWLGSQRPSISACWGPPWTSVALELTPRTAHPQYRYDGLHTVHNHTFAGTAEFRRAYQRAVKASGWDYEIYWRVHVILWAAATAQSSFGAFVECGTGRGFMASAICEHLAWADRTFYLFDTFESEYVRPDSHERQERSPCYANGPDLVRENFREWSGVQLVVGAIPDSLAQVEVGHVAFVHIDMNHPEPEEAALRHFWPKLSPGGVIVFDDYAYAGFEALHRSADRVASELGFSILSLPTGQGLTVKAPQSRAE